MIVFMIATASTLIAEPIPGPTQDRCTVIRYAADGRRTESQGDPADFGVDVRTNRNPGSSSISVRSSGSGSSSVSASASSRGGARSTSSASFQDGERTVTTHTDNGGCTIIVDERPAARRDP